MTSPSASGHQLAAASADGPGNALTFRSGSEVVAVVEALHLRLLIVALGCIPLVCGLTVIVALVRTHNANFARTAALAIGLALLAMLALRAPVRLYRALRRRPWLSLTAPLLALSALAIDGVTYSPLSYPAAVSIALAAFVCGRRWALTAAALISVGAVTTATLHNGLGALEAVGQGAAGYFVWALVLAGLAERFARLAMRMPPGAPPPKDAAPPAPVAILPSDRPSNARAAAEPSATTTRSRDTPASAAGLTSRQLQVLALLADGLRAEDIAQRLGITTSTVYRHIERAKQRAGVQSRYELVGVLVGDGILPPGTIRRG